MAALIRWRRLRSILLLLGPKPAPVQLPALADDLLREIFLRVASQTDLVRAAAACAAFRRVILDATFLRRHRSLHPPRPLLLGLLHAGFFQPAEPPHPNAHVAHLLSCAAGFSFDHLPPAARGPWRPRDACDGRVLLASGLDLLASGLDLADLAVCDPLSGRYLLLPPVPDDLLASVQPVEQHLRGLEPLLVPSSDGDEDETSFRVILRVQTATKLVVFVYSTASGCWIVGSSTTWDALGLSIASGHYRFDRHQCVNGCFFWRLECRRHKVLRLEISTMELSAIDLPPGLDDADDVVIGEAGEGKLRVFGLVSRGEICSYAIALQDEDRANEWQMESTIPLPSKYNCYIQVAAEGYIFLIGIPKDRKVRDKVCAVCFSLEMKTLKIEMVTRIWHRNCYFYPYFGFPPSMSPRRV
ncbi:hypothetical protein ACP4OV_007280 [Aristida adscensionis]